MLWTSDLVKNQIKAFFPKFYFAYLLKANVATTSVNSLIDRRSDWGSWPGGCILFFINSTPPFGRSGSCRLSWGERPLQWRKTIFLSWVCAVIWDSSRQQPLIVDSHPFAIPSDQLGSFLISGSFIGSFSSPLFVLSL